MDRHALSQARSVKVSIEVFAVYARKELFVPGLFRESDGRVRVPGSLHVKEGNEDAAYLLELLAITPGQKLV
jgi:hypothetical protein